MASVEKLDSHPKALNINLDPTSFGSFAGIGAGLRRSWPGTRLRELKICLNVERIDALRACGGDVLLLREPELYT
jgi:hypothetical protein